MAKQNNPQIVARKESIMTITDVHGNVIVEVGQREYTVRLSDGSLVHRSINQHIQTVDGASWSPPMQLGKPPLYVGICQQCRDGTSVFRRNGSHGICLLPHSRTCVDCGTLCCPAHRKLGRDQRWRCLKHHRTHLLRTLIRPLFFERTDQP
jgi:hypothetical protein